MDLGQYVGGGFVQSVTEIVEGDPLLNMRPALGSRYRMEYDWSEMDRQLFNEGEKDKLYTVYTER